MIGSPDIVSIVNGEAGGNFVTSGQHADTEGSLFLGDAEAAVGETDGSGGQGTRSVDGAMMVKPDVVPPRLPKVKLFDALHCS